MSKTGSAAKVKLNSFDDLFGTEQPQTGTEQVQEIALSELHEFKGHPFKVLDDEKMQETMESIREHGVLMPGIARPMKDGGYGFLCMPYFIHQLLYFIHIVLIDVSGTVYLLCNLIQTGADSSKLCIIISQITVIDIIHISI